MSPAHFHLIVTHVPVMGVVFGTILLAFGLVRHNRLLQQTALIVLVLAGLAAGVAYLTGEGAEEAIENTLGSGKPYLERHEQAGLLGLIGAGIAGALAVIILVSGRRERSLSRSLVIINLVVALATSGTMAWVANLGGQIVHSEIRSGHTAPQGEVGDRGESD